MIGCVCKNEAGKKRLISSAQETTNTTSIDDGNGDYIQVNRPTSERQHSIGLDKPVGRLDVNRANGELPEKCFCFKDSNGLNSVKENIGVGDVETQTFFQKKKTVKVLPSVSPIFCPGRKDDNSASPNSPELPDLPIRKGSQKRKKKKKKFKSLSICTSNCKYEVVRRVAARFGMREVGENFLWNLYWTDLSVSVERAKEMKRFQKINHFPGMNEICRKDLLARNLNRMLKIFPKDYNFFPMTWCLPSDHGEFSNYARPKRNKTYICKPDTGCQGRGIYVTRSYKDIKPYDRMICQVYLHKPFLIDGFKFDLRVYTLITSCDPLRIFVYNDGLARFATSPYKEPTVTNSSNVFMHLTNYAVNKHSRTYKVDEEAGSKRKISTLNRILSTKSINVKELWSNIDDIIVKTVIAAHPTLKHSYNACFPSHDFTYACFELLGFDVLIDHKLKPYLLEVNHSPSFHTELQIDREIKESLLMDTFEILNLSQADKKKIIDEDRRRVRERLLQGIIHKENSGTDENRDENDRVKNQTQWEEKHMGNFRCIYPCADLEKYDRFFNQNASSLFQDTAASRAREECSRIQRQEMLTKAAKEAAKRSGSKPRELDKLRPESASSRDGKKTKAITAPPKKKPLLPDSFYKLTNKYVYCDSTRVIGSLVVVITSAITIALGLHFFPPQMPVWRCVTGFLSLVSVLSGFAMWYLTCYILGCAGEMLVSSFKEDVMLGRCNAKMIYQYRRQWLRLSELATLAGMAAWRSFVMPLALSLWLLTLSLYGFIASMSDFSGPIFPKLFYASSTVVNIIPVTILCDQAHWIPIKIKNSILIELQKFNTFNVDSIETWREVVVFQQMIHMNPTRIDLGGFLIIDRQLLQATRRIKPIRTDYYPLNSFLPEKVEEDEENERKSELAQRDFLIKSYNLTEQIYLGMMKNGTLREADKRKYGSLGRFQFLSNSSPTNLNKLPLIGGGNTASDKLSLPSATSNSIPAPSSYAVTELTPTCNNVAISARPAVPNTMWHGDQSRSTKADEARSFTNTVKLHGLEKRERHLFNNA